jgi:hypothetical protein
MFITIPSQSMNAFRRKDSLLAEAVLIETVEAIQTV